MRSHIIAIMASALATYLYIGHITPEGALERVVALERKLENIRRSDFVDARRQYSDFQRAVRERVEKECRLEQYKAGN